MTTQLKVGQTITATIEGAVLSEAGDSFIFTGKSKLPYALFVQGAEVPAFERTQWAKAKVTGEITDITPTQVTITYDRDSSRASIALPTDDEQITFKRPLSSMFSRR